MVRELNVPPTGIPTPAEDILKTLDNPALFDEKFRGILKWVWESLYQLPILAGYGQYWALQDEESKQLTDKTVAVLNSVDSKTRKKIVNTMNKWGPISTFGATLAMVTYPRVMYARLEMQTKQTQQNGGTNATPTNPANGASRESEKSAGDYPRGVTRTDPFDGLLRP